MPDERVAFADLFFIGTINFHKRDLLLPSRNWAAIRLCGGEKKKHSVLFLSLAKRNHNKFSTLRVNMAARRSWFYKRAPRVSCVCVTRTHTCMYANTHTHNTHICIGCAMRGYVAYGTVFKNGDQTENDVINIASIFSMDSFYSSPPSDLVESFIPTYTRLYEEIDALLTSLSRQGLSFPRYSRSPRARNQIARQSG